MGGRGSSKDKFSVRREPQKIFYQSDHLIKRPIKNRAALGRRRELRHAGGGHVVRSDGNIRKTPRNAALRTSHLLFLFRSGRDHGWIEAQHLVGAAELQLDQRAGTVGVDAIDNRIAIGFLIARDEDAIGSER